MRDIEAAITTVFVVLCVSILMIATDIFLCVSLSHLIQTSTTAVMKIFGFCMAVVIAGFHTAAFWEWVGGLRR